MNQLHKTMSIEEKLKALYEEKDALSKDIEIKTNRLYRNKAADKAG